MIKKYSSLVFIVLLNSCAMIFNNHTSIINIHSDVDSMRICLKSDTTKWHQLPTWIEVNRSRYDLPIITEYHNIRKTVNIDEKLSNTYIFGNVFSPYFLGYIVDLASSKTFKYPNYILLLNNDKKKSYTSILKPEKGRVNFKISIPYGINFAGKIT